MQARQKLPTCTYSQPSRSLKRHIRRKFPSADQDTIQNVARLVAAMTQTHDRLLGESWKGAHQYIFFPSTAHADGNMWAVLPDDAFLEVMANVGTISIRHLCLLSQTCKRFCALLHTAEVWELICTSRIPTPGLLHLSASDLFRKHTVLSFYQKTLGTNHFATSKAVAQSVRSAKRLEKICFNFQVSRDAKLLCGVSVVSAQGLRSLTLDGCRLSRDMIAMVVLLCPQIREFRMCASNCKDAKHVAANSLDNAGIEAICGWTDLEDLCIDLGPNTSVGALARLFSLNSLQYLQIHSAEFGEAKLMESMRHAARVLSLKQFSMAEADLSFFTVHGTTSLLLQLASVTDSFDIRFAWMPTTTTSGNSCGLSCEAHIREFYSSIFELGKGRQISFSCAWESFPRCSSL